ncbi:claudin-10-like isoform X2 [Gouania willdenowi]|uniref:Claudin n=1 Tax=Gouania willdenowi TaxID=441366 RepID=A0A8C5I6R5_GOUWI|nr:claudin-10-like isoform X2 [Gouania willdenowi]
MSGWQMLAFFSGLIGLGAIIGATVSNEWKATSRASSVITATWVLQGLWNNCAGNALGALHCRPHHTILNLDGYIQACRGLMISAVCLGFFGSIFALVGMKCTKIGGSDKNKARIACFAGGNFILSGLCALSACSLYAHRITSEFFDPLYVAQKYELGAALFIGWAGSVLCIIGGSILCFSISSTYGKSHSQVKYIYKGAALHSQISTNTRDRALSVNQRPPPDYSNSSRIQHFDKNAYV